MRLPASKEYMGRKRKRKNNTSITLFALSHAIVIVVIPLQPCFRPLRYHLRQED